MAPGADDGAAGGGGAGGAGGDGGDALRGAGGTPWHAPDYATLVTGKGWKTADDALKSYRELEAFRGRSIAIPEADKIDDAFRADVFKKINYTPPTLPSAPEKIEDYGITPREGTPPEYTQGVLQAAHKAGLTKEQLGALVEANDSFATASRAAEDKLVSDRVAAADAALTERFKDKTPQMQELMTREAARLGYDDKSLKAAEEALALIDDKALVTFRNLLADVAEARKESPLHRGATQLTLDTTGAKAKLDELMKNSDWVSKATQRGTPEAAERLMLNARASGSTMDEETAKKLSAGTLG